MPSASPHTFSRQPSIDEAPPVAYIRPVEEDGCACYAICDEEGQPLGLSPTRALAIAAIRQHGMEPADAH